MQADSITPHLHLVGWAVLPVFVSNLEGAQGLSVRGLHATPMVETEHEVLPVTFGMAYGRSRAGHMAVSVVMMQSYTCQTLTDGALVAGMHIKRVAMVARHGHPAMGNFLSQATLYIAEMRPCGASDAAELYEVERHNRISPSRAPTVDKSRELNLEEFHIMSVRLALIPDDSAQRKASQRYDTRLVEVARLVRMTLLRMGAEQYVLVGTAAHPRLYALVMAPVSEDISQDRMLFLGVTIGIRLYRSSTHGIADETDGNIERVGQHCTEVVGNSREMRRIGGRKRLPRGRKVVIEAIELLQ